MLRLLAILGLMSGLVVVPPASAVEATAEVFVWSGEGETLCDTEDCNPYFYSGTTSVCQGNRLVGPCAASLEGILYTGSQFPGHQFVHAANGTLTFQDGDGGVFSILVAMYENAYAGNGTYGGYALTVSGTMLPFTGVLERHHLVAGT